LLIHMTSIATKRVALQAMTDSFDECRAIAAPRAINCDSGSLIHSHWIFAVHAHARHLVSCSFLGKTVRERVLRERRVLRVLVILTNEYKRQLPDRSESKRFVKRACAGCAITKAHGCDAPGTLQLR